LFIHLEREAYPKIVKREIELNITIILQNQIVIIIICLR